jgi:hypothetical protein
MYGVNMKLTNRLMKRLEVILSKTVYELKSVECNKYGMTLFMQFSTDMIRKIGENGRWDISIDSKLGHIYAVRKMRSTYCIRIVMWS